MSNYPVEAVAGEVRRRAHLARTLEANARAHLRRPKLQLIVPVAGVVAAVLALFLMNPEAVQPPGQELPVTEPGVRLKGLDPELELFRQRPDGAEQLAPGAAARAGDLIQLRYNAAGSPYGAIASVDGRGAVTLHHPARADLTPEVDPSGAVTLDHAYELDDAPAFERFFFVTSVASFELRDLVAELERLASSPEEAPTADPALADGLELTSFLLTKTGGSK